MLDPVLVQLAYLSAFDMHIKQFTFFSFQK